MFGMSPALTWAVLVTLLGAILFLIGANVRGTWIININQNMQKYAKMCGAVLFVLGLLIGSLSVVPDIIHGWTNASAASVSTPTAVVTPTPPPTSTFTPTPPAYPENTYFSCQSQTCQQPSRIQPPFLVSTTVDKTGGVIQLRIHLKTSPGEDPYISTGDIKTDRASFVSLTTPDGVVHKVPNTGATPSSTTLNGKIGQGKELLFIFAQPVTPGHYEIGMQLIVGGDLVVYNAIPFDIQ